MPTFEITGPDGGTYEVDAPDENTALSAMGFGGKTPPDKYHADAVAKMNDMGGTRAGFIETGDRYLHGATFGAWDKVAPYIHAGGEMIRHGVGPGEALKYGQALQDEIRHRAERDHPTLTGGANLVGNIGSSIAAGGVIGNALGRAGVGATLLQDGVAGAATGSATALGDGENPLVGAGLGGAGGVAGNLIGKGISSAAQFFRKPNVPSIDMIRDAKNAAYDGFDKAGGAYTPGIYDEMRARIQQNLSQPGVAYSQRMHGATKTVLDELDDMAKGGVAPSNPPPPPGAPIPVAPTPPTMSTVEPGILQNLRILAGDAIGKGEARTGYAVRNAIDDVLFDPPSHMVAAPPGVSGQDMGAALKEGNRLNRILQKAELVNNNMTTAARQAADTGSGGNINNKTRQSLTKSLGKRRDWTPDELAAFEAANQPSRTEEMLRRVGKLAPGGNGLMQALNIAAIAKDPMNVIYSAAAQGAKFAGDRAARRRGQQVLETILNGGKTPAAPPSIVRSFIENNPGMIGGATGALASYPSPEIVEPR